MKKKFVPFWIFLMFFKLAGSLHYSLLSPLGERVFPLWVVGILVGAGSIIQLVLDVPAGYILDRFGYKKLLGLTTGVFIAAAFVLLWGITQQTFLATVFVSTFGWLFFGPGINAYVINQARGEEVGKFFSLKDICMSLGVVVSSSIIIFAVRLSVPMIGLLLGSILVCAYIAVLLIPQEKHIERMVHRTAHSRTHLKKNFLFDAYRVTMRLKPVSILLLSLIFSGAVFYSIIWFVVPLLIVQSIHNGILGIGLGIFDFAVVILGFMLGWLVDSYEKKLLILLGLFVFSVCSIFIGYDFGLLFLFLGFLATTGDELASLSLWAWLYTKHETHESEGLISGTINLFEDFGWAVGPMLAGVLYEVLGATWTLSIGGIFILCNLIIFFFLVRHPLPQFSLSLIPKKPHRRRYKH